MDKYTASIASYCIQIDWLSRGTMRIFCAVCLLILGLNPTISAKDNIEEMKNSLVAKYIGKVVTLRHFYAGPKLLFNADGSPTGRMKIGPWTTCSKFEITKLDLNEKKLKLQGHRIFLYFDREQKTFILLRANQAPAKQTKLAELRIEIPLIKDNGREPALYAALDGIFLKDTENLVNSVPQFWKLFLSGKTIPGKADQDAWYKTEIKADETGVVAPQLTRKFLPHYTEEARMFRCEGVVLLAGVIDKDTGKIRDLQIIIPLGFGLEESAINNIEKWQFTPGRRNGKPVSVQVNLEVSFRLY
jgi:TonB family protein